MTRKVTSEENRNHILMADGSAIAAILARGGAWTVESAAAFLKIRADYAHEAFQYYMTVGMEERERFIEQRKREYAGDE